MINCKEAWFGTFRTGETGFYFFPKETEQAAVLVWCDYSVTTDHFINERLMLIG